MTEDELMALMAITKKQHESVKDMKLYVERLISEQRTHEELLMRRIESQTQRVVEKQIKEALQPLTQPVQQVVNTFKAIRWQPFMYITTSAIVFIAALMWLMLWWMPDFKKIEQGRADARKYQLDYSRCNGEICVRVIRSKCGYGKQGDYCVVDPK